ncbi:MAG: hypothetical protein MZV49_08950 [Rhodopseudomonas palustris]|nr:hypothetical protein [Rhodopseudomonas palustris]
MPTIALTSVGEPAGIGPELCAMLAARHAGAPFPARIVVLGDRALLGERARRIGLTPRYVEYDPASFAPHEALEVWHMPVAMPVTPGRPDPTQRRGGARNAAPRDRRLRDRRVRRAGDRAGAEERDQRRRRAVHRPHRVPRRAHAARRAW